MNSRIQIIFGFWLLAMCLQLAIPAEAQLFYPPVNYHTGSGAWWIAKGDINGDTITDLATVNYHENNASVLLGNGDGTFQDAINTGADFDFPWSVAIGDLDNDGYGDMVVANNSTYTDGNVMVLLSYGDGTFQTPVTYLAGVNPTSVEISDLNNDGNLDLVVAASYEPSAAVLLGNGDGTFQTVVHHEFDWGPFHVAVGDLNGDTYPDLVGTLCHGDDVAVLMGNGNGTFQAQVDYPVGGCAFHAAIGDLNGDTYPDLAVVTNADSTVAVLQGNGNGTFQTAITYPTPYSAPQGVEIGDIDGDGYPDLAVAHYYSPAISLLRGNGDCTFQIPEVHPYVGQSRSVVLEDFDGDSDLDVALGNSGHQCATVLLNTTVAAEFGALQLTNTTNSPFGCVRVPDDPGLEPQVFTLEAWITPQGPGYYSSDAYGSYIISKTIEGASGTWLGSWGLLWSPVNESISFVVVHDAYNSGVAISTANQVVLLDSTAHIAGTFDGDTISIYVNGNLEATAPYPYSGVWYGDDDVVIGARNYLGANSYYARRYHGIVDEVRIWDHARDGGLISARMNCRLEGDESGLLAYWSFADTDLSDDSGNGHHGIACGSELAPYNEQTSLDECWTLACDYTATPSAGTLPFSTQMRVSLTNTYPDQIRQVAARINVTLAGGQSITNWRGGYTNLDPGETHETVWTQSLPAMGRLVGINHFDLEAEDVTPIPYNQPPYPPAGDTATGGCTISAAAP